MLFFHIMKSLDELLYELMTWLFFYPVTLWRSVRHPLRMMEYARSELRKRDRYQFRETLRPPIFLLVTVILAHLVELGFVGDSKVVSNTVGLADLIDDDTSLIIFRIVAFAIFPVAMATIETILAGQRVNRETLQEPFYAQCFLAAPFALALSLASTAVSTHHEAIELGAFVFAIAATLFYIGMEALWLRKATNAGGFRAFASAIAGYVICMLILTALGALLGGE